MTLKVYNTLTRKKEEFVPIEPGKVKMYVCGPTVYNYIHIGNGRPVIFFDVVRRYLESQNYEVTYITNFTDVDDKMIRKAEEMAVSVPELAETFIAAFLEDISTLGVHEATLNPRVTENIQEIIDFIAALVEKDFAYEARGDVYYRTSKFADYGKLSNQNLEELQYGIRVEVDDRKENPQDFVLWKAAKPGEIYWDSPWGQGRPGWHIECSAMVRKYLGETIDIHGGGQDLTFPHHECEIAQTEAVTGHPMANYWLHNAFLNIDNEKMSKSLGNGILIRDLVKQIKPEVFRFFMLSAHYRNPLNFSDESLTQAANALERIQNAYDNLKHRLATASATGEVEAGTTDKLEAISKQFVDKMNDDFNTPDAITAVFDLVAEANLYLQQERVNAEAIKLYLTQLEAFNATLGILSQKADELLDEEIEQLIVERTESRKAKNWARADEIRVLLTEKGIFLEDTPQGDTLAPQMTEMNLDAANLFTFPPSKSPNLLNPLVLAYIGDAVYEVYIRQYVISGANHRPNHLHKASTGYVSAKAQSKLLTALMPTLTEEEVDIVKRGRNAKSGTTAKNADVLEYRHSTAFECLIGYLYYKQAFGRLKEILDFAITFDPKQKL